MLKDLGGMVGNMDEQIENFSRGIKSIKKRSKWKYWK